VRGEGVTIRIQGGNWIKEKDIKGVMNTCMKCELNAKDLNIIFRRIEQVINNYTVGKSY
jgi:hypothetical protein